MGNVQSRIWVDCMRVVYNGRHHITGHSPLRHEGPELSGSCVHGKLSTLSDVTSPRAFGFDLSAKRLAPPHLAMTHIVLESCIRCKYTDCVDVCPVDCFREGPNMLVIDPDECIDCAVCIPECPVEAIKAEEDVSPEQMSFIKLNADLSRDWPSITRTKPQLSDADSWKDVKDKLKYLQK